MVETEHQSFTNGMVESIVGLNLCVFIDSRCVWKQKQKASKIEMFVLLLFVFYFFVN